MSRVSASPHFTHYIVTLTVASFIISSAQAVVCRQTDRESRVHPEAPTCLGDFCTVSAYNVNVTYHSCINGSSFSYLNDRCWSSRWGEPYCVCNTDNCTDNMTVPKAEASSGGLKCGKAENCTTCVAWLYASGRNESSVYGTCGNGRYLDDIPSFPQSCTRSEIDGVFGPESSSVKCLCNTTDDCASTLAREQTLDSGRIICHLDKEHDHTVCSGDMCYIAQPPLGSRAIRGCLRNNETLFPGLLQPAHMTYNTAYKYGTVRILCDTSLCNADLDAALDSLQGPSTTTASNITEVTPSASREVQLDIEYTKLFTNIKAAFDNFMSKFAELYG